MAGTVLKVFGILFLLAGIVLALVGVGAAVFGALDAKDHQEEQGPLGIGKDEDRQKADEALVAGGALATGLGIILVFVGIIFLLVGGRDRGQQQQQVILSTGAAGDVIGQQQQSPGASSDRRTGLAVAGVVALLLVVVLAAGLVGDNPLSEALSGAPEQPVISSDSHIGNMGPALYAGAGPSYGGHQQEFVAPYETQSLRLQYVWSDFTGGAERLRLVVSVETGSGVEVVATRTIVSGDVLEIDGDAVVKGGDWSGMSVRFRIEPADAGVYQGQPFEGVIQWMR